MKNMKGMKFLTAGSLAFALCMAAAPEAWAGGTYEVIVAEINETNFPDAAFRNFIISMHCDADGSGYLSEEECANVKYIDVGNANISSLKGIEYFTNLAHLSCWGNQLTSLDVSKNTELTMLSCESNQLTSLDVSNNTNLETLSCGSNQLTSLDVSNNINLTELRCSSNQLTSLDVSNNTNLIRLYCGSNQLTSLNVSSNPNLNVLWCSENQLTSLNVSNNINLTGLYCDNNQLTSLDVSNNTNLGTLICGSNQLTSLDVSRNTNLTYLSCYENQLTSLNVSNNINLTELFCTYNQLTSLDVSRNTELTSLSCYSNQLTSLDVSNNPNLTYLSCGSNQLISLDVSRNINLTGLDCSDNLLTSLDVSNNVNLDMLRCYNNQLTSLDVSNAVNLTELDCYNNQLTSLDVSGAVNLTELDCYNNQLTSLDVSKNVNLTHLGCWSNQLTSLDVSKNTNLIGLSCDSNEFPVTAENGIFNLSSLPGFDPARASKWDWRGATYNSADNTLTDFTADKVTYLYDLGNGLSETFTLDVTVTGSTSADPVTEPEDTTTAPDSSDEAGSAEITVENNYGVTASPSMNQAQLENAVFDEYDRQIIADGGKIEIVFSAAPATPTLDEREKTAAAISSDEVIGAFIDLSIVKIINDSETAKVTDTGNVIVTVTIPADIYSYDRSYSVVRIHDGYAQRLSCTVNRNDRSLTFTTDKFSTYAIVYSENQSDNAASDDDSSSATVVKGISYTYNYYDYFPAYSSGYTKLKADAKLVDGNAVISWNSVADVDHYTVYMYRNDKYTAVKKTADNSVTIKNIKGGETKFMIRYTLKNGRTPSRNFGAIVTVINDSKPAVSAVAGTESVKLKWTAVDGAEKYAIYSYINGKSQKLGEVSGRCYALITDLDEGREYSYYVRAYVNGKWTKVSKYDVVTITV